MSTRKPWSVAGTLLILLVSLFQTPAIADSQGKAYFTALEKRLVADGQKNLRALSSPTPFGARRIRP